MFPYSAFLIITKVGANIAKQGRKTINSFFATGKKELIKFGVYFCEMNFLAHLFLSCDDEKLMVGNFIADMISNKQLTLYPEAIRAGVLLHRKIDHYTDNHPIVLQGVRRLYDQHRKYAPVVIDVYYDYLLANHWEHYSDERLTDFTQRTYQILEKHRLLMPARMQENLPGMIADDWLTKYGELYGMERAFGNMRRRVSQPEWLDGVIDSLLEQLPQLEEEFDAFFPDLIRYVKDLMFDASFSRFPE